MHFKCVFTVLEGDTVSELVKDMGMFVDKVVHYKSRIKFDKELWKFQTGGAIASTPAIVNDAIIFGLDLSVY